MARRKLLRPLAEALQVLGHGLRFGFGRCHHQSGFAVHGRTREGGRQQKSLGRTPEIADAAVALLLSLLQRPLELWQDRQLGRVENDVVACPPCGVRHDGSRSSRTSRASLAAQFSASFSVRPQALGKLSPAACT